MSQSRGIDRIAACLVILAKYEPGSEVCAEHDVIYAGHGTPRDDLLLADRDALEGLDCVWNTNVGAWEIQV